MRLISGNTVLVSVQHTFVGLWVSFLKQLPLSGIQQFLSLHHVHLIGVFVEARTHHYCMVPQLMSKAGDTKQGNTNMGNVQRLLCTQSAV